MKLYFLANSVYQFAYALPIYRRMGGTFIVPNLKKYLHFKREMKNVSVFGEKNWRHTPDVIIVPRQKVHQLSGILLFLANTIDPDASYGNSITLFHEHGTSDKKYEGGHPIAIKKLNKYDYILLSGPKNRYRLQDISAHVPEQKLIEIGCFRFEDFSNDIFMRSRTQKYLNIKKPNIKTVLYAPTWRFGNGTLRTYSHHFIKQITTKYNLIIRPHYHDRKYAFGIYLYYKLKGVKNLYYSPPEVLIKSDTYTSFSVSELLISDMSSVIYEYLITKNPIIIAKNEFKARHDMPDKYSIYSIASVYKPEMNILSMIDDAFENIDKIAEQSEFLLNNCFYNASGGAINKVIKFIKCLKNHA